ncbi:MAG: metal ABC transporter permease [Treponema sp.]|jgi:zinc transport system permease protein|nr:metal ABC transporter permease [Treponema sp.]
MNAVTDTIISMFSYTFIVRAVIVGFLVSLCASLLGVSLVLKRYSMIGDGLSHVGFGSLAVATAFNMAPLAVSIPVVIAAAFLLLRLSENSKIKGDAAIALFSTGALAIGVMVISVTTGLNTDVCNYLFGSILAMSKADVRLSIGLSVSVLTLFVLFYNKIFAVTFDETFARASGVRAGLYNMIIALLTAVTIVLGMRMMGALLISSLIIFPALSSMRLLKSFRAVTISSALVSICCFFAGILASYIFAIPTGASVVIFNMAVFAIFWLLSILKSRMKITAMRCLLFLVLFPLFGACQKAPVLSTPTNAAGTRAVELSADVITPIIIEPVAPEAGADGIIEIREKMFIAQTNDVYLNAEDYLGKTIKVEGLFKSESYEDLSRTFCFVLRNGPGCCGNDQSAGFEVAWGIGKEQNMPKEDDWVEAVGALSYYEEDGYPYLYLALNSLKVKNNQRGAEYVIQ